MTDTTTTSHDPTCTDCVHDCPWSRRTLGAPWCAVCDDHSEAQHAGYGDDPCDCGDPDEYVGDGGTMCTMHGISMCSDPECVRERGGSVWASELRDAERFLFS